MTKGYWRGWPAHAGRRGNPRLTQLLPAAPPLNLSAERARRLAAAVGAPRRVARTVQQGEGPRGRMTKGYGRGWPAHAGCRGDPRLTQLLPAAPPLNLSAERARRLRLLARRSSARLACAQGRTRGRRRQEPIRRAQPSSFVICVTNQPDTRVATIPDARQALVACGSSARRLICAR